MKIREDKNDEGPNGRRKQTGLVHQYCCISAIFVRKNCNTHKDKDAVHISFLSLCHFLVLTVSVDEVEIPEATKGVAVLVPNRDGTYIK